MRDKRADIIVGLIVLIIGVAILFGIVAWVNGQKETAYTMKATVYDHDVPANTTNYSNLTDAEERLLYDAFKKSDHFLGGTEATVYSDEDGITPGWHVYNVRGVPVLVAIQGPIEVTTPTSILPFFAGLFGGLCVMAFGILIAID